MPEIVLYMTMSLDGFITGPHDDKDNPLGLDGGRLFNHGAGAAQALLRSGLLDQMEIHLVPVLLGRGRRPLDQMGPRTRRAGARPQP